MSICRQVFVNADVGHHSGDDLIEIPLNIESGALPFPSPSLHLPPQLRIIPRRCDRAGRPNRALSKAVSHLRVITAIHRRGGRPGNEKGANAQLEDTCL